MLVQVPGMGRSFDSIVAEACRALGIERWGGVSGAGWSKHSDFLRCPYRFYLKHMRGMGALQVDTHEGPNPLDVGSTVHFLLATHYARYLPDERYPGWRPNCPTPQAALAALAAAGLPLPIVADAEQLYDGYVEHWSNETIIPVGVEMPAGLLELHTARYDLVFFTEDGLHDGLWIGEHKTASPATDLDEFRFDGEILGEIFAERSAEFSNFETMFGGRLNGVCVNALIKPTKRIRPRYQRLWLTFPDTIIDEYAANRKRWMEWLSICETRNVWPRNLYGCKARYRRCRFWEHCRTQDEGQLIKLERP